MRAASFSLMLLVLGALPAASRAAHWSDPQSVDPTFQGSAVSCASTSFCVGVSRDGKASTFDGSSWGPVSQIDDSFRGLEAVDCWSSTSCTAVDLGGRTLTFDGKSWSAPTQIPGVNPPQEVPDFSCASPTFCVAIAVGPAGTVALTYRNRSWEDPVPLAIGVTSVACPSSDLCVAVNGLGDAITYDGQDWSSPTQISGVEGGGTAAVWCTSSSSCLAVFGGGGSAAYDGHHWSAMPGPASAATQSVSCASPDYCLATGSATEIFDGHAWSTTADPDPQGDSLTVSCAPASEQCLTLSGHGRSYLYSGGSVTKSYVLGGGFVSVSCGSASFCVAADPNGRASTLNGQTWSQPKVIDQQDLSSVSCASASFCVTVDGAGDALTYGGSGWSSPSSIDDQPLTSVSCATVSFCVAVDRSGRSVTFTSSSWSEPIGIGAQPSAPISCAAPSFCVAISGSQANTFNGTAWSAPVTVETDGADLLTVSCVSASQCVALDDEGRASIFDGTNWSTPVSTNDNPLVAAALSCASPGFCVAVDDQGDESTFDGTTWSETGLLEAPTGSMSVSCVSSTSCAAIDVQGNALTYANSNQLRPPVNYQPPFIAADQPVVGQTVDEEHGEWFHFPTGFSYQWKRCDQSGGTCTAIPGATEQSYMVTPQDTGHQIEVQETAHNAAGFGQPSTSFATLAMGPPIENLTSPTITGVPVQGGTLAEAHGTWDGDPTSFGYQWFDCDPSSGGCAQIGGATGQTYVLTSSDVGFQIMVEESASAPFTSTGFANSTKTGIVQAPASVGTAPQNTSPPTVSGALHSGKTLTASTGTWTGTRPIWYAYQWQRCRPGCTNVRNAIKPTYHLGLADEGAHLRVVVTANNAVRTVPADSAQSGPVTPTGSQVRRALSAATSVRGRGARIGRLLANKGYGFTFGAPGPGRLTIVWSGVVTKRGAAAARATQVARTTTSFGRARRRRIKVTLTAAGRRLLSHAAQVRLSAKATFAPVGARASSTSRTWRLGH